MFLSELCDVLGVSRPDPAGAERARNDYVFERGVKRRESEGSTSTTRIDLYKRCCFILEAKQSRTLKGTKADDAQLQLRRKGLGHLCAQRPQTGGGLCLSVGRRSGRASASTPDWSRLAGEAWALEEMGGEDVGWPLAAGRSPRPGADVLSLHKASP
jgi:hypothetical protein